MTIKEIEEKTGMTRANIRFYETEGLIVPLRSENKYRVYTSEDLERLHRIKLLRSLNIPIEEIKRLQTGESQLSRVLETHIIKLEYGQKELERTLQVCRNMKDEGVRYENLDAEKYLKLLKSMTGNAQESEVFITDSIPKEYAPWRRFFARTLDLAIYSLLWDIILIKLFNYNILEDSTGMGLINTIVTLLIMYIVEPILLSVFGTTIGKCIFGIRVTGRNGRKLSYSEARSRTVGVLWHGMAFYIPILDLIFLYRSYKECTEGWTLAWEYDSDLQIKEMRAWRALVYIGIRIIIIPLFAMLAYLTEWCPENKGDITIAEFCENYNQYSELIGYSDNEYLAADGSWKKVDNSSHTIYIGGNYIKPKFEFFENNGLMTGMSFEAEGQEGLLSVEAYQNEMKLAVMAFVGADEKCGLVEKELYGIIKWIEEHPFEKFEFEIFNIQIICKVETEEGESISNGIIWNGNEMNVVPVGNGAIIRFHMAKIQE